MKLTQESAARGPRMLVYWHDMALPHSRFLIEAFDRMPEVSEVLLLGPRSRKNVASIFTVPDSAPACLRKSRFVPVNTFAIHEKTCTLGEWARHVRAFQPDLIVVLDEAFSANVLAAAIVNRLFGHGVVMFYGFENTKSRMGWPQFIADPNLGTLPDCLRRTFRNVVLGRLARPLRRRWVGGGLVSYAECADLVRATGWSPPMIQQWWGINDAVFTAEGPKADLGLATRFKVGFVGRFIAEKGVLDLVEALAHLGEDYGVVLIGDGPQRGDIAHRIQALGIANRARIVPPQNQTQLASYYRALDLLVLPSHTSATWKEQYGRVLMEAMLCGAPVIGSDSGSIPTVVARADRIFPESDPAALAETIARACAAGRLQEECPEHVQSCRSDAFARAWISLAAAIRAQSRSGVAV